MIAKSSPRSPKAGELNPKNTVQSLAKGFRVLHAFTADEPELKLSEVARRAGLDNGTAFRLLETLVMLGYLERLPDTKQYRLTLKPLELGFNAIARMDLRTIASPSCARWWARCAKPPVLEFRPRRGRLYRALSGRAGAARRRHPRGKPHSGLLHGNRAQHSCVSPRAEVRRILSAGRRVKINEYTPATLDGIEEQLREVRVTGYAVWTRPISLGYGSWRPPFWLLTGMLSRR